VSQMTISIESAIFIFVKRAVVEYIYD